MAACTIACIITALRVVTQQRHLLVPRQLQFHTAMKTWEVKAWQGLSHWAWSSIRMRSAPPQSVCACEIQRVAGTFVVCAGRCMWFAGVWMQRNVNLNSFCLVWHISMGVGEEERRGQQELGKKRQRTAEKKEKGECAVSVKPVKWCPWDIYFPTVAHVRMLNQWRLGCSDI